MPELDVQIERWDELIRKGKGRRVAEELGLFPRRKIPRESLAKFTNLCWRAHTPETGLLALNRRVRGTSRARADATDAEKLEYAVCLGRCGAVYEALGLVSAISGDKAPFARFYEAGLLAMCWEYRMAIPLFREHLKNASLTEYQRWVGLLNLASAYVFELRHREAASILRRLIQETRGTGRFLLHANALHLSASSLISQRRFREADGLLKLARKAVASAGGLDALFVDKWAAILSLLRSRDKAPGLKSLDGVSALAAKLEEWNTVRECDRFRAIACRDETVLWRVYFGTPYRAYRKRLLDDFGGGVRPPSHYLWTGARDRGTGKTLDTLRGDAGPAGPRLKPGGSTHRLLRLLCSDFYRRFRLAEIHDRVFAGTHFNPATSPAKVHQAVKLLRRWFDDHALPIEIEVKGNEYRLVAHEGISIRVDPEGFVTDPDHIRAAVLRGKFGAAAFSSSDAASHLGLSVRAAVQLLKNLTQAGVIEKSGTTRGAAYSIRES